MAGNPFLLAPEVNANPLLSDSWSRCQRYGLDPATEDFPRLGAGELADRLAGHRGLQQLAQPVVEALSRQVADLQSVVILSDPDGLVLHTLGDTQALQKAQRVALAPGNLWSESGRGTNAIGTALAIDDGCGSMAVSTFLPATRICTARRCRSSDRTEASPGCWISPARRIFPTSTPLAG